MLVPFKTVGDVREAYIKLHNKVLVAYQGSEGLDDHVCNLCLEGFIADHSDKVSETVTPVFVEKPDGLYLPTESISEICKAVSTLDYFLSDIPKDTPTDAELVDYEYFEDFVTKTYAGLHGFDPREMPFSYIDWSELARAVAVKSFSLHDVCGLKTYALQRRGRKFPL